MFPLQFQWFWTQTSCFHSNVWFLQRVSEVSDTWWHSMLILPPLFKESPAGPFLAAYYPDCVGMSPSGSSDDASAPELRADRCRAVQPQSESVGSGSGCELDVRSRTVLIRTRLSVPGLCSYFQPFYQPNECGKALCVRPDMMELDELYEFPEFSRDPTMYLALRNLILASWHRNCKVRCAGTKRDPRRPLQQFQGSRRPHVESLRGRGRAAAFVAT